MVSGNTITTVVGTGEANFSGDSGPANAAYFEWSPWESLSIPTGDTFHCGQPQPGCSRSVQRDYLYYCGHGPPLYALDRGLRRWRSSNQRPAEPNPIHGRAGLRRQHFRSPILLRIEFVRSAAESLRQLPGTGTCDYTGDGGLATAATLCSPGRESPSMVRKTSTSPTLETM